MNTKRICRFLSIFAVCGLMLPFFNRAQALTPILKIQQMYDRSDEFVNKKLCTPCLVSDAQVYTDLQKICREAWKDFENNITLRRHAFVMWATVYRYYFPLTALSQNLLHNYKKTFTIEESPYNPSGTYLILEKFLCRVSTLILPNPNMASGVCTNSNMLLINDCRNMYEMMVLQRPKVLEKQKALASKKAPKTMYPSPANILMNMRYDSAERKKMRMPVSSERAGKHRFT